MRFIQRYKSPKVIGIGDKVRYQNKIYDVLKSDLTWLIYRLHNYQN